MGKEVREDVALFCCAAPRLFSSRASNSNCSPINLHLSVNVPLEWNARGRGGEAVTRQSIPLRESRGLRKKGREGGSTDHCFLSLQFALGIGS